MALENLRLPHFDPLTDVDTYDTLYTDMNKVIDYGYGYTRATKKRVALATVDAIIGTLLFVAFTILSMGLIALLA